MTSHPLEDILTPRSVAVIGVSPAEQQSFAMMVVQALKEAGFPHIYPVNPKYAEVLGLPCYRSVRDIPGTIDHVVVSIPAESVLALLDDCIARKVKSAAFFTAGFGESGHKERLALERAVLAKARSGGLRVIGPNCVGLFVPKVRLTNGIRAPLEPGTIAFISQSGGNAHHLPYSGSTRGLRFSKVVSYGNALDVNENELLDYFAQDPDTRIVAGYIEGLKDGQKFIQAMKKVTARKPLVIYKGGTTEAGRRAAYGHTASLTSSVAVFAAVCRQVGAIPADDLEELIDVLVALRFVTSIPKGRGVAIFGTGGGPSVLASDEMESAGLCVPALSAQVRRRLAQFLPLAGSIFANPVDAVTLTQPEVISATIRVLGAVPDVHMLVYHLGFHPVSHWGNGRFSSSSFLLPFIEALRQGQQTTGKPILLALRPAADLAGMNEFFVVQEALVRAGFSTFPSLRQIAKAMSRVLVWNNRARGS